MRRTGSSRLRCEEPIVITGIGLIASVGLDREAVWRAVQRGDSGVERLVGLEGIADGKLIGAPVRLPHDGSGRLKVIGLLSRAAEEALGDAGADPGRLDAERFGCAISAHVGDTSGLAAVLGAGPAPPPRSVPYWHQWLPNTGCSYIATRWGLHGPRLCHSTACASGLVEVISAARCIRDGQCDIALAGSAEAINPLFAAGFSAMRVLATHDDPRQACRPFDARRNGFVMGEGAAMFVLERLGHAVERNARIYAEVAAGRMMSEAHHVTDIDLSNPVLAELITATLRTAGLAPDEIGYINAHGTGTQQNDAAEARAIRIALGRAADTIWVSSTKSMLGHLVSAAGSVELAITALALRDGFAPPTLNLTEPDPDCDLDCIPLVGRRRQMENALKVSAAFGGHLAAVVLRRWGDAGSGFDFPARAA